MALTSLALTGQASNKGTTQPSHEHPQVLHLLGLERPAASLEAWLDAGLLCGEDEDDGADRVNGRRQLPAGYEGCSKSSVLVEATKPGVWVWPVRFDIGELSADMARPRTLYHYTHKASFARLARELGEAQQPVSQRELSDFIIDRLTQDHKERELDTDPRNPKGDIELCSVEPGMFRSKREIRKLILGSDRWSGFSSEGHRWEEFADYCIPIRLPGSACRPRGGSDDRGKLMFNVSKEVLHALYLDCQARAEALKAKRELGNDKAAPAKAKKLGCLGFFLGGDKLPEDEWEDNFSRKKQVLVAGKDVINRPKRDVGHMQQQMTKLWMKDHFSNFALKEGRRSEEEEGRHEEPGAAAKEQAATPQVQKPSGTEAAAGNAGSHSAGRLATAARRAAELLEPPPQSSVERQADRAMVMYREFQVKTEGNKEFARGALARIKSKRSMRRAPQQNSEHLPWHSRK